MDPASGAASETAVSVKVTAGDNPEEQERTAIITVTAGELTKTVSVTQAAKEAEQQPDVVSYTLAGTIKGTAEDNKANYWKEGGEAGLMTKEGDWWVVKGLELVYDYSYTGEGEDYVKFKICKSGTWDGAFGLSEKDIYKPNEEIAVVAGGSDIYLDRSGVYDVYFDETNGKVWVMDEGYAPGEEKAELDGYQWMAEYEGLEVLFDFGLTEEGMLSIAVPLMDGTGYGLHMTGFYEIEAQDKSSGVILYTGYDWEWDEIMDDSEFEYFELTATTVKLVCEDVFGVSDAITLTKVEYPCDIELPGGEGGGDDPQGPVANGWYRLYNSGKVMAPLAVGVTSGNAPASSAVNADETITNKVILISKNLCRLFVEKGIHTALRH